MSAGFREFLRKFVKLEKSEWSIWENLFVKRPDSPWSTSQVSVDMLKQFLTRQVTKAAMAKVVLHTYPFKHLGRTVSNFSLCEDDMKWETNPDKIDDFFQLMCNYDAQVFLREYAS